MNTVDPLEAADTATLAPREYYGQVLLDTWFAALVKGVGKVPYDPTQHKSRVTAIKIDVIPLPETGITNPISREMIAESKEWVNYTLASLKALGIKTAELRDRWVKMTFVQTGESYTNAAGEKKEKTAMKFLAVYASEDACRAAWAVETGGSVASPPPATEQADQPAPNGNGHANVDPAVRTKLLPFVQALVKKACAEHPGDLVAVNDAVSVGIASHSTLKNFFTPTDQDVLDLISEAATPF